MNNRAIVAELRLRQAENRRKRGLEKSYAQRMWLDGVYAGLETAIALLMSI